jgi:3'(2'), 5'-bisphosphate nucleotidase
MVPEEIKIEDINEIAVQAGQEILKIYEQDNFEIKIKQEEKGSFESPLTQADIAANKVIVNALKRYNYPILSEEENDNPKRIDSRYVWIVDPLDGTKEFIKRNGEFTVNIALVKDNRPILGSIYVPATGELYYATEGQGAFYNEKKIEVPNLNNLKEMTIAISRSHLSDEMANLLPNFFGAIKSGSSIKGCLVARAEADLYLRLGPVNEWDICAMHAIINEAGGTITRLDNSDILYNQKDTLIKGFLCSNKMAHKEVLGLLKNG